MTDPVCIALPAFGHCLMSEGWKGELRKKFRQKTSFG
jgi:hypothetical protein